MHQNLNKDFELSFKYWKKIKNLKKKEIKGYFENFIKRYLKLNKRYLFNKEISGTYINNQIDAIYGNKKKNMKFLPVGIKDNINTKFLSTNYGLKIKKNFMVGNNANVVDKLIDNGSIIFSKTHCAEYAVHHINKKFNINPYNKKHIAGTSSSGSAIAVACGALPVTLGTQTAGSIIRPSSFCGVFGFKPTFGSIDRTGILKNNDLFDTVGILASEIEFIQLVFKNVLNDSKNFPWIEKYNLEYKKFKSKKKFKIGYFDQSLDIYKNINFDVKNFYEKKLNKFKKEFLLKSINGKLFNKFHNYHDTLYNKSLSYYFKNYTQNKKTFSRTLRKMINKGEKTNFKEYKLALKKLEILKKNIRLETSKFDFIVVPSTFSRAPKIKKTEIKDTCLIWTTMGYPCINIPFKDNKNNLPFGLLVVSNEFTDFNLLKFCIKKRIIKF
tara:strand:- start:12386 stop:13705 length:1320 start_codon:yes stop_codon:yes gene_type:complete